MKKGILITALLGCCIGCLAVGASMNKRLQADALVADLFDTKGISVLTENKIQGDERQGVALLSKREGVGTTLVSDMGGTFSMDYKFYTESKDYYLTETVLSFSDKQNADNEFELHIVNNALGISYYVQVNGVNAGIYYEDGKSTFLTNEFNKKSIFTRLASDEDMVLSFDPETLCVYVQTDALHKYLVWNLASSINDGKDIGVSLTPFGNYEVALEFTDYYVAMDAPVAYTGLQIYEMNGQALGGVYIADSAAPTVHAGVYYDAIDGKEYTVPVGYAYDVKDGAIENVSVAVKNSSGTTVAEGTGAVRFTPTLGDYVITYTATDKAGRTTQKDYPLKAQAKDYDLELTVKKTAVFENGSAGVNSVVTLPNVTADSRVNKIDAYLPLALTVSLNGQLLEGWNGVSDYAGKTFQFEQTGDYRFSFLDKLGNLPNAYEVNYTITENAPSFAIKSALPESYAFGMVIPEVEYEFTYGGVTLDSTATLVYPDGSEQPLGGNELNASGYYTAVFKTEYDGVCYEHKKTLTVNISEFSLQGKAEAFYGVAEKYDMLQGLIVCLSNESDSFRYNKVVDLRETNGKTSILTMYALPRTQGTANVKNVYVTLTDIYDESNTVTIKYVTRMADIGWYPLYVFGAATGIGQSYIGTYGSNIGTTGSMTYVETAKYNGAAIMLGYDLQTNTAYTNRTGSGETDLIIADFDNEAYFDTLFGGFTTGEVYISVSAEGITERAEFLVQKIGGYDVKKPSAENTKAPNLTIDYKGYDSNALPLAFVGEKYPLLPYMAKGLTGNDCPTEIQVYKDGKSYEITDGKFTPDSDGEYLVRYTARDGFNSETTKEYVVKATTNKTKLILDVVDFQSSAFVGYDYELGKYGVYGQSGNATVQIVWRNLSTGESNELFTGTTSFEQAGMYAVTYTATDYLGRVSVAVKYVKVTVKKELLVPENVAVPFALIDGASYRLPEVYGTHKNDDGSETSVLATLKVVDGTNEQTIENYEYKPSFGCDKTVKFVYTVEKDGFTTAVLEREVFIRKTTSAEGTLIFEKYFVTDESVSVQKTTDGVEMTASADGRVRFINPVVADGAGVSLNAIKNKAVPQELDVYFTDSLNPNISVKIRILPDSDTQVSVLLNDSKRSYKANGSFTNSEKAISFSIDNLNGYIYNDVGLKITIDKTQNGEKFTGFPSQKVYVSFGFTGVTQNATLLLSKINNQNFNVSRDTGRAQVVKLGNYGGRTSLNETVKTSIAIVSDVLSAETTGTLSVYDPDGDIVTSVDGVRMNKVPCDIEYEILCDKYGAYEVVYYGKDGVNKEQMTSYVLNVVDVEPPQISVEGNIHSAYSLGDTIQIPKMTTTDENGVALSYVMVENADGIVKIYKETTLTFNKKGKWVISYVAYDKEGNMAIVSYTVIVQ